MVCSVAWNYIDIYRLILVTKLLWSDEDLIELLWNWAFRLRWHPILRISNGMMCWSITDPTPKAYRSVADPRLDVLKRSKECKFGSRHHWDQLPAVHRANLMRSDLRDWKPCISCRSAVVNCKPQVGFTPERPGLVLIVLICLSNQLMSRGYHWWMLALPSIPSKVYTTTKKCSTAKKCYTKKHFEQLWRQNTQFPVCPLFEFACILLEFALQLRVAQFGYIGA